MELNLLAQRVRDQRRDDDLGETALPTAQLSGGRRLQKKKSHSQDLIRRMLGGGGSSLVDEERIEQMNRPVLGSVDSYDSEKRRN